MERYQKLMIGNAFLVIMISMLAGFMLARLLATYGFHHLSEKAITPWRNKHVIVINLKPDVEQEFFAIWHLISIRTGFKLIAE